MIKATGCEICCNFLPIDDVCTMVFLLSMFVRNCLHLNLPPPLPTDLRYSWRICCMGEALLCSAGGRLDNLILDTHTRVPILAYSAISVVSNDRVIAECPAHFERHQSHAPVVPQWPNKVMQLSKVNDCYSATVPSWWKMKSKLV